MIELNNLLVSKNGKSICNIDELKVARGERVAIVGPNGSGKTTMLRVLAGLESGFSGICNITTSVHNRTLVHQSPLLFRGTVMSNVRYGLAAHGYRRSDQELIATRWLERMAMGDLANARAGKLSGGEMRRTALVRALVLEPELLLLDEPFADLDDDGTQRLIDAIGELGETTIVVASPVAVADGSVQRTVVLPCPARPAN